MSDKASIITLNCLISGEEANDVFGIKISCEGVSNSNDNRVSILADKIRNCRLDLFKDTDSSKLILYMNKAEADSVVILGLKNDKGAILNGTELMKHENTILSYFNGQPSPKYQGEKGSILSPTSVNNLFHK
ncbi:hypothetical protein GLOIN_2v1770201 [Rhizophagus irregularis DAOM 181602=DAOM 197198]|uniref:Crinkler effector protein N-terminal domain-containing protein n=1 Tax=Rhizophagus irregularis (strain DAOM 181602 / DAOM 197198 / MUCL 43194) TaxID=747089 RepID=A0A2P4QCH5_RHIID|nr:hypothetical protein GLOIN_2v1770201 [Rhizophagus irregularis DAOM 181602=DAOM 197198]POG75343.1 hypothetical protein GLOIN_2v1770201 [Rhizophagus irregularis DAOM 181602=DAOM 197198]|eukprot:XP_025182209.1 hypothetical protein GLOIN_2v1770201 [Rhizophagus irregularis DAOM 181602=DAOM 197198]